MYSNFSFITREMFDECTCIEDIALPYLTSTIVKYF